jgi:hypothetical protein
VDDQATLLPSPEDEPDEDFESLLAVGDPLVSLLFSVLFSVLLSGPEPGLLVPSLDDAPDDAAALLRLSVL